MQSIQRFTGNLLHVAFIALFRCTACCLDCGCCNISSSFLSPGEHCAGNYRLGVQDNFTGLEHSGTNGGETQPFRKRGMGMRRGLHASQRWQQGAKQFECALHYETVKKVTSECAFSSRPTISARIIHAVYWLGIEPPNHGRSTVFGYPDFPNSQSTIAESWSPPFARIKSYCSAEGTQPLDCYDIPSI